MHRSPRTFGIRPVGHASEELVEPGVGGNTHPTATRDLDSPRDSIVGGFTSVLGSAVNDFGSSGRSPAPSSHRSSSRGSAIDFPASTTATSRAGSSSCRTPSQDSSSLPRTASSRSTKRRAGLQGVAGEAREADEQEPAIHGVVHARQGQQHRQQHVGRRRRQQPARGRVRAVHGRPAPPARLLGHHDRAAKCSTRRTSSTPSRRRFSHGLPSRATSDRRSSQERPGKPRWPPDTCS
jgi:hypothetical protein